MSEYHSDPINGKKLRRDVETVRTLNATNEPLRELVDEILAEQPIDHIIENTSGQWQHFDSLHGAVLDQYVPAVKDANQPASRPSSHVIGGGNARQTPTRQLVIRRHWAVATDGIQWILQRCQGGRWRDVSFVRSTKAILARCMREQGATAEEMGSLLADLPEQFVPDSPGTDLKAGSRHFDGPPRGLPSPSRKTSPAKSSLLTRNGGTP